MAQIKKGWGGKWTVEKLDAFEKYVKAYLTIMNRYRDASGWKLLYFDGFAGSGSRADDEVIVQSNSLYDLFGPSVDESDLDVYRGAAERVVRIESEGKGMRSFDHFYFIDKIEDSCNALENKLSDYVTVGKRHYLNIDANEAVNRLANTLSNYSNCKALAFLDPFGMQIEWDSIKHLKDLSVDLWILVPTGVIVNRLLERNIDKDKGRLVHAEKLESFFGMPEEDILSFFYRKSAVQTLFGEEEIITKTENSIRKIADLYITRLQNIFEFVTPEPMVLYNNHNVPIYHLIFAAKNETALKIAHDIIKKK